MQEVIIERRVNSGRGTRLVTKKVTYDGHVYVLQRDGNWTEVQREYGRYVANLVLETFKGHKPTPKHECCHSDDNSENNHADNLYWGTHRENMQDAYKNDCNQPHAFILSENERDEVRVLYSTGEYFRYELAEMFGVSTSCIRKSTLDICFPRGHVRVKQRASLLKEEF